MVFNGKQTWAQKTLAADDIYKKVVKALKPHGLALPKTPRRPDIRLIVENNSGETIQFMNPGDHAKQQPEIIPATGDSRAIMVMLKGDTLEQQFENARKLDVIFKLSQKGLTKVFADALGNDQTLQYLDEAYGPAPFGGQADRLVPLAWETQDRGIINIDPYRGALCAYGARAAENETVFRNEIALFIKGTNTIPECVEGDGMCVAVSEDWQTGKISTRPIVPSVAREFYGAAYDNIPTVLINPLGFVQTVDLKNGQAAIDVAPPARYTLKTQNLALRK